MKKIAFAAAALMAVVSVASAEETNPNIVHRQAIYKIAAAHMAALKSILVLNFEPARDHVHYHAMGIKEAFQHHKDAFPPGSDKGETKAKPEIWTKNDEFKAAGKKAGEAIDKLVEASATNDLAAQTAAFKGVGAACKACHEDFKKD